MGEIMTAEEINARFESEWVLVADPETEENLTVTRGKVLWHGKDKAELYRKLDEFHPRYAAILYTGAISKEEALAYQLHKMKMQIQLHGSPT